MPSANTHPGLPIMMLSTASRPLSSSKNIIRTWYFLTLSCRSKDGIAATKEIIAADPDATIIIVSSVGTQMQLKKAIEAGAKDFIQKPISQPQVDRLIEVHLGGK